MSEGRIDRAAAINAVLRAAIRHENLLRREAFEDLLAAIKVSIPVDRVAILTNDADIKRRVFAETEGPKQHFGKRVDASVEISHIIYREGKSFVCDDSEAISATTAMESGIGSFVSCPIRAEDGAVIAELVFAFYAKGIASTVPLDLLEEISAALSPCVSRALRRSRERRLAMIIETSGDAMLAWDREGRITDCNGAALRLTGLSRAELIGNSIEDLFAAMPSPPSRPPTQGMRFELLIPTPAGERRVAVGATITRVEDDALVAAHALLRDLSLVVAAEKEAEGRLKRIRELEEQHRTLLDNAPLIIFRLDPATKKLVYLNRHAERLLGIPTSEALATDGFLREAHADPEGVAAFDRAVDLAQGGVIAAPYEARLKRRGGDAIIARGTAYPLMTDRGHVAAIEGVLADVSAEHEARTRLVQTDRLSTLGMLAAGVAHEINNPAAFILLGLDMLDRALRGPGVHLEPAAAESAHDLLRELRDSIRRIVDIARDLRLFASPPGHDAGRRSIIDVGRAVDSALSLTRGQIIERARIVRDLDEQVPPVVMEDGRLGQVIVNLLVNAAQAIPKNGPLRDHKITVRTQSDGEVVEIVVSDTGTGIPDEVVQRIWQPFFTTKSPDVGTGLGLSISREIVERAGGRIIVESPVPGSDPPCGSRFTISLPAAGAERDRPAHTPMSAPLQKTHAEKIRVLVVEDEPALARALAEELGRLHAVEAAGSAQQALTILNERSFDVILCDLRMPGMSGEALYAEVERRNPTQARGFIFMTGVGFGADVERFVATTGRPLLEKPFSADDALELILRVVSRNKKRR